MGIRKSRRGRKTADNSKMGEDFFKYLPSDIIVNILSRLPTRAAMICKCVCKPWLVLLATPEFVKSHISRSVLGIAVETHSKSYEIMEFVDEIDRNYYEEDRWDVAFNFRLPFGEPMHSSANGLIFLRGFNRGDLILCNPITREYIKLPCPRQTKSKDRLLVETFGFGVSRMTGQYKVVRIFVEKPLQAPQPYKFDQYECQVYTVGTGSWRKIRSGSLFRFFDHISGVLLKGNLHWLVTELGTNSFSRRISCLDLETELFSAFTPPPPLLVYLTTFRELSVLRGCLCVCEASLDEQVLYLYEIQIWLMKEYGDEKSWTKEFIIREVDGLDIHYVSPIRVFKNGDILMAWGSGKLFYYSNKTKTIDNEIMSGADNNSFNGATIYASSFLLLKTFAMENVNSF